MSIKPKRCLLLFIDDIAGCPISCLLNSILGLQPFPIAFHLGPKAIWYLYLDLSDERLSDGANIVEANENG